MGDLGSNASDPVRAGLTWMPDGGFANIRGNFRTYCTDWATTRLRVVGLLLVEVPIRRELRMPS